jgi:crossover junction endodeoxyribonuclease RusA
MKYTMTMPPSANKARASVRGRLISTKVYREWLEKASDILRLHWLLSGNPTIEHDVELSVVLYPKDKRRQDIDNRNKGIFDALVKSGILADDSQVKKLTIEFDYSKKGCVDVFIKPYFPIGKYGMFQNGNNH